MKIIDTLLYSLRVNAYVVRHLLDIKAHVMADSDFSLFVVVVVVFARLLCMHKYYVKFYLNK